MEGEATESSAVMLECCLEGIESACQALHGGAHRVELCANLAQGGVTPSIGDIEGAVSAVEGSKTRVHVLIRPRPGDFVYSEREKQVMVKDVQAAVNAGAHGVVIGALLDDGTIDENTTASLIGVARAATESCSITFHRAFDVCTSEATAALEILISRLGVDRVLTSGRAESAWDGRDTIARLVEAGRRRIVVMPEHVGWSACAAISVGTIEEESIAESVLYSEHCLKLLVHTGVREVHVGSSCHENFPQASSVSLGPSDRVVRRVSRRLVSEILHTLA